VAGDDGLLVRHSPTTQISSGPGLQWNPGPIGGKPSFVNSSA
jgi:hypothetical protein